MSLIIFYNPTEASFIELRILERISPDATDYWESNWCKASLRFDLGQFHGVFDFELRTDEINSFYQELIILYKNLSGSATLKTLEEQVYINLIGDGRGHFDVSGFFRDQPGMGNKLNFQFTLDQTYLPQILEDLKNAIKNFPVLYRDTKD